MIIEKQELTKKLKAIKGALPSRSMNPAQTGFLVDNNTLYANNLKFGMSATLNTESEESFIISTKAMAMINTLPNGEISLTCDSNNILTIEAGNIKNKFICPSPKDFIIPEIASAEATTVIDGKKLKEALTFTVFAVFGENGRPSTQGVLLNSKDGIMDVVGVDGYRMQWAQIPHDGDIRGTIPKEAILKLLTLKLDDEVTIRLDKNQASFVVGEYTVNTRLCEGEFIAYSTMFVEDGEKVTVDRSQMVQSLERANIHIDDKNKAPFVVEVKSSVLRTSVKTALGSYEEVMPVAVGEEYEMEIGFNHKYLQEALNAHKDKEVTLVVKSELSPVTIKCGEYRSMVLPVRLKAVQSHAS